MKLNKVLKAMVLSIGLSSLSANAADLNALSSYAKISVADLKDALSKAHKQQKIIDAMTRPSEGKPWWQYRKIFITKSRINAGVKFYLENEATLKKAEKPTVFLQRLSAPSSVLKPFLARTWVAGRFLMLYTP